MSDLVAYLPRWLVVCERGERWKRAIQKESPRTGVASLLPWLRSLREPPSRSELASLNAPVFLLIEVYPENLTGSLDRLADLTRQRRVGAAALFSVELSRAIDSCGLTPGSAEPSTHPELGAEVEAALLEAGAICCVRSTLALGPTLRAADRFLARGQEELRRHWAPAEAVRRSLPWQASPWPVG